jgi:hypothetical protein
MQFNRRPLPGSAGLIAGSVAGLVAVSVLGVTGPALAGVGPVSTQPASGTPALPNSSKPAEQVRQLVQCGGTMYAVGRISAVNQDGTTYARHNAFSFMATAPYQMTSWDPDVNGKVNSIAFNGKGCHNAYLGGHFSVVDAQQAKDIVEVSTSTGKVNYAFGRTVSGQVETLLGYHGRILAGGYFRSANGGGNRYFASLNATTGRDDGFIHLNISGKYSANASRVYNQQLSHSGHLDLVEGVFTSVGGTPRQQIFMLDLSGSSAKVTGWTSPEFSQPCQAIESFYVRAASWSPDDRTVYIATTGYHPLGQPVGAHPRTGLCDAAAAFPATQTSVSRKWINYTGCDSLYATAADRKTAYFGGHERWADNKRGCNFAGRGAIRAPGMVGLSPSTGAVAYNPTRARGFGADDMLITSAGLWVASDNAFDSNRCGHVRGHAGICFLPYS